MTTPTPQPSEEAVEIASVAWQAYRHMPTDAPKDFEDTIVQSIAAQVDTHLAPLRERAEKSRSIAKDFYEGYLVKIEEERAKTKAAMAEASRLKQILEGISPGVYK